MNRILFGLLLFPVAALGEDATAPPPVSAESPQMIAIEVTLLDLSTHIEIADATDVSTEKLKQVVQDAASSGALENLTRIRLSTIAGQQSVVETQAGTTIINGWTFTGKEKIPNYIVQMTGSVVGVLAEPDGEGKISVSLDLDQTRLVPGDLESDETPELDFPQKRQYRLKTTSIIPDGKTILVSGSQQIDQDTNQLETILLVRASTVK